MKRRLASQLAGLAAATTAAAAFVGGTAGLPLLSTWGLGAAVKPPVALCLVVLGLALVHPGRDRRLESTAGLAVGAAAALHLPVVALAGQLATSDSFQIPGATLLALAFAGCALGLSRFELCRIAATALAGLAGLVAVLTLLGYLTGLETLYGSDWLNLPPLPTALALLCIVCGMVLQTGRMPVLRTPQPLWRLLVVIGCATVAPLLLFGAYAGSRMAGAQLDHIRKDLISEARAVSAEVDRLILDETEKLRALAASPSLRQGDFAAFQRQAEAALAGHRQGMIFLVAPDMDQLVNTWMPYGTPLPKASIREPVERALSSGKPQYTGLFMGPVAGRLVFGIVVPVTIDGEHRYALGSSPDPKTFVSLVAALELPPAWQAVVTDADHQVIARSGQDGGTLGAALPPSQRHQEESGGIIAFTTADGRPALQAFARSELTGWETAIWVPQALLAGPVLALWRTLCVLALLAFVLAAVLATWLGRIISGSVRHASGAAAALGAGAPLPPGKTPIAEVNALVAQLHEAAARRQVVEHLLRESEESFRAMFDKSSVPKIEVVPWDGRFLRANPAMCRFVGYSEAELLDMTVWDITHPDERESQREPVRRLLSGELPVFDIEKRYVRKNGTPVWAHTTSNVIRDDKGQPVRDIAVIQDIDARKRAEQDLQASKDRLELALDAARLGSWQYDSLRGVFSGDRRAKDIFDFDQAVEEAPVGEILGRLHPDDVETVLRSITQALDPADPQRAVTQFRVRRPHGEFRWIETLGQGYFEGAGAARRGVSIVGTCQDITARKEREEKEHLLMREINHRAKNMLSVVHAIAHQTASRNPEDFIARFSERIQALSANQDLLVRNEWNGVEVGDLVRAQLAPFVGLIGSRIAVHGRTLRLTAASAQAIGLALHELATNAGKYGALSAAKGRVDIRWGVDGDTFTMRWTESEGPPVAAPQRRGFGSVVMDLMAERSVGGTVDLDYAPSGLAWRLTCPAANVLEPWVAGAGADPAVVDGSGFEGRGAGGSMREGKSGEGKDAGVHSSANSAAALSVPPAMAAKRNTEP